MRLRARSVAIVGAVTVVLIVVAVALVLRSRHAGLTVRGVVLRQDPDPRKQLPIPNVKIVATEDGRNAEAATDTSGLFELNLLNGGWRERPVSLLFSHPGYQPLKINLPLTRELYVARMQPVPAPPPAPRGLHEAVGHEAMVNDVIVKDVIVKDVIVKDVIVKDVRVRYSEKTSSTVNVGSTAKTFTVPNTGNVACAGRAALFAGWQMEGRFGGVTIDAGQGQQFQNARVSCIAGPCPFTKIETGAIPRPGRTITVMVRNWSDTVTYLVEAEVTRSMPSDAIRQAYPAIYGRSYEFHPARRGRGPKHRSRSRWRRDRVSAGSGAAAIVGRLHPPNRLRSNQAVSLRAKARLSASNSQSLRFNRSCTWSLIQCSSHHSTGFTSTPSTCIE